MSAELLSQLCQHYNTTLLCTLPPTNRLIASNEPSSHCNDQPYVLTLKLGLRVLREESMDKIQLTTQPTTMIIAMQSTKAEAKQQHNDKTEGKYSDSFMST